MTYLMENQERKGFTKFEKIAFTAIVITNLIYHGCQERETRNYLEDKRARLMQRENYVEQRTEQLRQDYEVADE